MANSISHAALPFPVKAARYTLFVPYLDADGDPTDPTTPDTERSIDAAAYADCTEEVTTVTGTNGSGILTLTGDETNGSLILVAAKVASGPKATLLEVRPRVLPTVRTGTAQAGAAGSITLDSGASAITDYYVGCIVRTTGGTGGGGGSGALNNQARVITAYNGSTKAATIEPPWETTPDSTTTFAVHLTDLANYALRANVESWISVPPNALVSGRVDASVGAMAANTVTAAALATDAVAEIADGVWDEDATGHQTQGSFGQVLGDSGADADTIWGLVNTNLNATVSSRAVPGDAMDLVANAVDAAALAADAVAEIADGVWDEDIVAAHGTADTAGRALRTLDAISDRTNNANLNALLGVTDAAGADVPSQVTDEVWDEARAGHVGAGSFGEGVASVQGNVTGSVGSVTGSVGSVAAGGITAASIATDAIDADAVAADAVTEIQSGLATAAALATVQADTDNIQTRLPAALVGGRMDANLGAIGGTTGGVGGLDRSTRTIVLGTVDAGATTTSIPTSSLAPAAAVADQFKGRIVIFDEDTTTTNLRGQASDITANTAGGTLTVTALTTAPAAGDTFVII
jgi:hypothetical protein